MFYMHPCLHLYFPLRSYYFRCVSQECTCDNVSLSSVVILVIRVNTIYQRKIGLSQERNWETLFQSSVKACVLLR